MGAASSVATGDAAGVAKALDQLNAEVQAAPRPAPRPRVCEQRGTDERICLMMLLCRMYYTIRGTVECQTSVCEMENME